MKLYHIAVSVVFISVTPLLVFSQSNKAVSCETGKYTIFSQASGYTIFGALEPKNNIKDTLLIIEDSLTVKSCKCSDTSAVFIAQDIFSAAIFVFKLENRIWQFHYMQPLPFDWPHGDLSKDGKYSQSNYELISDSKLLFKKVTQRSDGSGKSTEEITYDIDLANKILNIEKITRY